MLGISVQNNSITLPVQALGIANTGTAISNTVQGYNQVILSTVESVKIASFLYTGLEGVLGGSNFQ